MNSSTLEETEYHLEPEDDLNGNGRNNELNTNVSSQSSSFHKVGSTTSTSSSNEGSLPPNPSFNPTIQVTHQVQKLRHKRHHHPGYPHHYTYPPRNHPPHVVVPDMRMESAYLKSIESAKNRPLAIFILTIWGQLISPFIQGFAWGLFSVIFTSYRIYILESGRIREWGKKAKHWFVSALGFSRTPYGQNQGWT